MNNSNNTSINNSTANNLNKNYNSIFINPVTPCDIHRIIQSLKNTTSTGYDEITTAVIKYVSDIISPVLCHIFNLCIFHGIFPTKLKCTIIKPLFKKEDPKNMSFYRPIALIPVLSKVLEKVIYESLYNYLEKFKIITEAQTGFRKNMTIEKAIYNFLYKVLTNVDNVVKNTMLCLIYGFKQSF